MGLFNEHLKVNEFPQQILIFAAPRTGTNYFLDLINKTTELRCGFEIFHMSKPYGLSAEFVSEATNENLSFIRGMESKALATLVRNRAPEIISAICRGQGVDIFKIFPEHLEFSLVKYKLLEPRSFIKILIDRKPLDIYISLRKAFKVGIWKSFDTSDAQIEIDSSDYLSWISYYKSWYQLFLTTMHETSQKYVFVHYDEIQSLPPQRLIHELSVKFCSLGYSLKTTEDQPQKLLLKQDNSRDYSNKVSNWFNFSFEIENKYPGLLSANGFVELVQTG